MRSTIHLIAIGALETAKRSGRVLLPFLSQVVTPHLAPFVCAWGPHGRHEKLLQRHAQVVGPRDVSDEAQDNPLVDVRDPWLDADLQQSPNSSEPSDDYRQLATSCTMIGETNAVTVLGPQTAANCRRPSSQNVCWRGLQRSACLDRCTSTAVRSQKKI